MFLFDEFLFDNMSVPSGLSRGQLLGLTTEEILTTTRCTLELDKAIQLE